MTITLMSTSSPPNYVNKSVTTVATLTGTLRQPTSVVDPIVTVEIASPVGFNYVYIPDFNRYYFVKGIVSEKNTLVSISMHVDVLMSYKSNIMSAQAIVKRQEYKFNLYLDDGIFKSYQNSRHKTIPFPNGFADFSYILALAGNGLTIT